MNEKPIGKYTLKELREMEYMMPREKFTSVVIVPTGKLHDSGFMAMKFILLRKGKVVGVVGGGSDVVHINGIGGYGKELEALKTGEVERVSWSLDCLPKSRCIRLFSDRECTTDPIICSDFCVYPEKLKRGGLA